MLNIDPTELKANPFPYLVQRDLFSPDLYTELKSTYPDFESAPGWRRMSKDLMRGDSLFAETTSSGPWKEVFQYLNSSAFLSTMIELFAAGLQSDEFLANPDRLVLTDHIETREWITQQPVGEAIDAYDGPLEELFVRMDFGIGEAGYNRPAHLDWRHRVCSLLLYFDDPVETNMEGGQLLIHDAQSEDAPVAATVEPENNMGVFKLDNNEALHSVPAVTAIDGQRKTVYVGLSSRGRVWRKRDRP